MNFGRARHGGLLPQPFEIFIIQKTKPAPLSCPVASDVQEVCESRGPGERAGGGRGGVQACWTAARVRVFCPYRSLLTDTVRVRWPR